MWWAIADPGGDDVLGMMSLFGLGTAFEHGSGRLGYWLLAAARSRGVSASTRRPWARPTLPAPPVLSGRSITLSRVRRTDVDEATWVVTQHRQWAGAAHTWAIRHGTNPAAGAVGTVTAYLSESGSNDPADALIEPDLPPEHAALAAEHRGPMPSRSP